MINRAYRDVRFPEMTLLPAPGVSLAFAAVVIAAIAVCFWMFDAPTARAARALRDDKSTITAFFSATTDIGTSTWILVLTAIVALFISASNWADLDRQTVIRRAKLHGKLNFVFFTVGITGILASLIKNTIGRARPKHLEELGPYAFDFARFDAPFASFPSGHATTFGALCMGLFLLLPRAWAPLIACFAILGATSRVMVGAHYPSDVIAGLTFGGVSTLLAARWLAQRGTLFAHTNGVFPSLKKAGRV